MSATNNIDKNDKANLVQFHFHDIGISLFQLVDHENQGKSFDCHHDLIDAVYNIKKLASISAEYVEPSKVYRSSEELFTPLFRFNDKYLRILN